MYVRVHELMLSLLRPGVNVRFMHASLQVLAGGDVAATRKEQMHMRARTEKKKKKKASSSGSLNKKLKRGKKPRGNKKIADSPSQRRKKLLAKNKALSSESLGKGNAEHETGSEKKKAKKKEAWGEWPQDDQAWQEQEWWHEGWPAQESGWWDNGDWPCEEPKKPRKVLKRPSAKASQEASPKASAKGKPKAKAKAKGAPKASAKGKPKAKAKAKARAKGAPKASAKGRPKAKAKSAITQAIQDDKHSIEEWLSADYVDVLMHYGVQALDRIHTSLPEFKAELRDTLPRFEMSRLNVYWGRPSCGVTLKATGKDLATFASKHEHLPHNLSLALAIQSGTSYASWLQCCVWQI